MSHSDAIFIEDGPGPANFLKDVLAALAVQMKGWGLSVVLLDVGTNRFDQLLGHFGRLRDGCACRWIWAESVLPDQVQPRTAGRDEVEMEPLVCYQPCLDLGVLVRSRSYVDDQVQVQSRRRLGIDLLEEFDELLMAVPRWMHRPIGRPSNMSEPRQTGWWCRFSLVVVGHRFGSAGIDRQALLGAIRAAWIWLFSSTQSTKACSGGWR